MNSNMIKDRILRYDFILPLLFLIFIGTLFVMALDYAPKTAELPRLMGGITLCLLVLELGLRLAGKKKEKDKMTEVDEKIEQMRAEVEEAPADDPRIARKRLLTALLSMVFFLVFINIIGYVPTSFILSVGLIRLLGYKRYLINLIFSTLFVGGAYFVFGYLLSISLPVGMVFAPFFE